nr:ribonuclease H-like domain-containing protein [Tanacetum cinerariifolium]
MAVLEYCAKHNMIAYLEKIKENARFHEIMDFQSRSSIFYALTPIPSPTQTSAGDQPPLTESSSDHNSSQDPRVDLEGTGGSRGDQVNLPYGSPLLGGHTYDRVEGRLNLEAFYALCTNLLNRVLALETVKDAQAKEILTLKARIKKLEKRWRKNAKSRPTKDDSDKLDAELDEYMEYIDTKEAMKEGRQSTVDIARPDVSTARQELNTLIKLKDDKTKGVAFKDSENTDKPARSILTLKTLPTIDPKDNENDVLEEPESAKKMTKSDFDAARIARDEEIVRQLKVELQAKVERERQREEQASMEYIANLYDKVQVRIDVDHELAVRWTHEEHEELIVDFVPIGSKKDERMIRDMNKKAEEESDDKGVDNTKKIKKGSRMKRMSKRQKTDVDLEEGEKLKTFLKIYPDEEGVIMKIFRSNGSSRWIKTFSEMVTRFDRLDLVELYNLVMQQFESTTPEERMYPLTTRTLERMRSLRLIAESASDAAYDLLRFIQKQFDAKGDEGYFIGYFLSSKAFRVFNKRTKKIEENLHVDFLKNRSIKKGTSPDLLFDIDTLTNSMNYVPVVVVGTSSTNISGTKEDVHQVVKENESPLRFIALPNWFHKAQMATSNEDAKNDDAISDNNAPQKEQEDVNRDK